MKFLIAEATVLVHFLLTKSERQGNGRNRINAIGSRFWGLSGPQWHQFGSGEVSLSWQ